MNKRELALLERAYAAEIDAAVRGHGLDMIQTRSKLADKLVADGLLEPRTVQSRYVTVTGYGLTHAGRFAYCQTC